MSFQTPITIKKALDRIHHHEYVLPAIQREFVWDSDRICRIFDSLMRGYPIGSFLFWKVDRENVRKYKYYDFVREYHQKNSPHCPPLGETPDDSVVAILDGQQRLTALNIGLRGSHAVKEPRKWWDNPDAFPTKRLYLNLLGTPDEGDEGLQYDFRFLTENRAEQRNENECWFLVHDILDMDSGPAMHRFLVKQGIADNTTAFEILDRLHRVVHTEALVNYFEEESQDLEKVLNIFIRTNSGGMVLSYSDLLLSIATAQWDKFDARKEIHQLVDDLNDVGTGFSFSKDFVLKAGLMLADISSVRFHVDNFTHDNMARLEADWRRIADALRVTVRLASSFGFSGQTLSAHNSLLPIAYSIHRRGLDASYLTSSRYAEDRNSVKRWLIRSLLKTGVWGAGLDTMLAALRRQIHDHDGDGFPIERIENEMARRGRALRFETEELQDLVDSEYGKPRTFGVLSLLYPFLDMRNDFQVDHVFPRSHFSEAHLRDAGLREELRERLKERANRLPNLQLLEGTNNREKSAMLPAEWIRRAWPDPESRADYLARHDLTGLPDSILEFESFYEQRRQLMLAKLSSQINGDSSREDA